MSEEFEKIGNHKSKELDRKFDRCVRNVDTKGGKYNAYAICRASLGKLASIEKKLELLKRKKSKKLR